eukprot:9756020-Alexandrium_andersonii.AAC.1
MGPDNEPPYARLRLPVSALCGLGVPNPPMRFDIRTRARDPPGCQKSKPTAAVRTRLRARAGSSAADQG